MATKRNIKGSFERSVVLKFVTKVPFVGSSQETANQVNGGLADTHETTKGTSCSVGMFIPVVYHCLCIQSMTAKLRGFVRCRERLAPRSYCGEDL